MKLLAAYLDRLRLPGFQGMSLLYVAKFFWEGLMKGAIPMRAAAISFKLFLAFFPGIILLLSLIPYIPIANFQENLMGYLQSFFPGDSFSLVESTLNDLVNKKHNTLLSVGFILTIYYASNSVNAILLGFNTSYNLEERGNPWMMRFASLILIFVLGLFMVIAIGLIVFSDFFGRYLHEHGIISGQGKNLLVVAKWFISILLMYTVISTLYQVGTPRRRKRLRFMNTGATFATIFFVLASFLFAIFVENFSNFNSLYGSLGTLLLLLIWLEFNCMILLLGFELNVSITRAKKSIPVPREAPRNMLKED